MMPFLHFMKLWMKTLHGRLSPVSILPFILAYYQTPAPALNNIRNDIATLLQLNVTMRLRSEQRNVSKCDMCPLYDISVDIPSIILELEREHPSFNLWEWATQTGRTTQSPRTNCLLVHYYIREKLLLHLSRPFLKLLEQHSLCLTKNKQLHDTWMHTHKISEIS